MRRHPFLMSLVLAIVCSVWSAAPAGAVVGGDKDVDNAYGNVGMFAVEVAEGVWGHGTCTLVDENVVLTAAHNLDNDAGMDAIRVSFAPNATELDPEGPGFCGIEHFEIIPGYWSDSLAGIKDDSKRFLRRDDVALVWLADAPPITPAKIVATTNWLDTLDLRAASFTVVGYGTTGFISGSLLSWSNPNTLMPYDGRRFREVRAINDSEVYADRYLKTTTGTAFGDSGGPLFYGDTIVGDTVWGESMRCTSPAYEFRLDSPDAQAFLRTYLPEDCFEDPM